MNGIVDFDPDKFIQQPERMAQVVPLRRMPQEWAHGLDLLADRGIPEGASAARWAEVLADARQIASRYQNAVLAAEWSLENLFGYDPLQPEGEVGLAVAMRGRQLVSIDSGEACLKSANGYQYHRPRMPAGCSLLWNFRPVRGSK